MNEGGAARTPFLSLTLTLRAHSQSRIASLYFFNLIKACAIQIHTKRREGLVNMILKTHRRFWFLLICYRATMAGLMKSALISVMGARWAIRVSIWVKWVVLKWNLSRTSAALTVQTTPTCFGFDIKSWAHSVMFWLCSLQISAQTKSYSEETQHYGHPLNYWIQSRFLAICTTLARWIVKASSNCLPWERGLGGGGIAGWLWLLGRTLISVS